MILKIKILSIYNHKTLNQFFQHYMFWSRHSFYISMDLARHFVTHELVYLLKLYLVNIEFIKVVYSYFLHGSASYYRYVMQQRYGINWILPKITGKNVQRFRLTTCVFEHRFHESIRILLYKGKWRCKEQFALFMILCSRLYENKFSSACTIKSSG